MERFLISTGLILGAIGLIFLTAFVVYVVWDNKARIKKAFRGHQYYSGRFKLLCEHFDYIYCEENYILFLLDEKLKLKKVMKLAKKEFPDILRLFLKESVLSVYERRLEVHR